MKKEETGLLEEKENIEKFTNEDLKNLDHMEFVTNLAVLSLPLFGVGYVLSDFANTHSIIDSGIPLVVAGLASILSKAAEAEYEPTTNFKRVLRKIRKKLAPVLLALNITTVAVSGWNISKQSFGKIAINKTGAYTSCKVIEDVKPTPEEVRNLLVNAVEQNILLTEEEKEQMRGLYSFFEYNTYLDFLKSYHDLNTLNVFYVMSEEAEQEGIDGQYFSRDNLANSNKIDMFLPRDNYINIYNHNKIEDVLPHEVVHSTGYIPIRFLNEGITALITSEYCYNGSLTNRYITEAYLTSIIIELVGPDVMLEAYSTRDSKILDEKLLENSDFDTVVALLRDFEEFSQKRKAYEKGDISTKEYEQSYQDTKQQLWIYLEQKLPCKNSKTMLEEISKKARICRRFERIHIGGIVFVPKYYYNRTKMNIGINASGIMTFEEAVEEIDKFQESLVEQQKKHS